MHILRLATAFFLVAWFDAYAQDRPLDVRNPEAQGHYRGLSKGEVCGSEWECPVPVVDRLAEWARMLATADAVGLLEVPYTDGSIGFCTATVIAKDAVITAYHCLHGLDETGKRYDVDDSSKSSLHIGFNKNNQIPGSNNLVYNVSNKTYVFSKEKQEHEELDFVVLPLDDPPRSYVEFVSGPLPPPGNLTLMMFHHQGGGPTVVDWGCGPLWRNSFPYEPKTKLLPHNCGTWKGSSGALVLTLSDRPLVRAIHFGWERKLAEKANYNLALSTDYLLSKGGGFAAALVALDKYWRDHPRTDYLPALSELEPATRMALFADGTADFCPNRKKYPAEFSAVAPRSNVERDLIKLRPPTYRYKGFKVVGMEDCFEGSYQEVPSEPLLRLWRSDSSAPAKHEVKRLRRETDASGRVLKTGFEARTIEPIVSGLLRTNTYRREFLESGFCAETTIESFGPPNGGVWQQLELSTVVRWFQLPEDQLCLDTARALPNDKLLQTLIKWEVVQNMRVDELRATQSGARTCATAPAPGCTINFDRVTTINTFGLVSDKELIKEFGGVEINKDDPFIWRRHVVQTIADVEPLGELDKRTLVECQYSANYPRNRSSVAADRPGVSAGEYCKKLLSGEIPRPPNTTEPDLLRATQHVDPARGIVFEELYLPNSTITSQEIGRKDEKNFLPRRIPRERPWRPRDD